MKQIRGYVPIHKQRGNNIIMNEYIRMQQKIYDSVSHLTNNSLFLEVQKMQDMRESVFGSSIKNMQAAIAPMQQLVVGNEVIQSAINASNMVSKINRSFEFVNTVEQSRIALTGMTGALENMLKFYQSFTPALPSQSMMNIIGNLSVLNFYSDNITQEEKEETEEVSNKIISEILEPKEKQIYTEDDPIVKVLPVNDQLLQYLAENPEELYKLGDRQFEEVMAEIYNKLGYRVKLTPPTRDGGKDIILTDNRIFGDFIYYVECKHYKESNHVGLGIVQRLHGVVNGDRVNGGILATTSFFSKPARDFVLNSKLNFQIKLQDYNDIQKLLKKAIR